MNTPKRPRNPQSSLLRASSVVKRRETMVAKKESSDGYRRRANSPIVSRHKDGYCDVGSAILEHSNNSSNDSIFVEDVKIAAAIKLYDDKQSLSNYYTSRVQELSRTKTIVISDEMLHEVIKGVETKCIKEGNWKKQPDQELHFMTCSPEREKRYQKHKAVMKRPPSLAPPDSHIYKQRNKMRQRQLEKKTVVQQKVNEVYNYLQHDPTHLKFICAKKMNQVENDKLYQRSLQIRYIAVSSVHTWINTAVKIETKRIKNRAAALLEHAMLLERSATIISKYYRRHVIMKEKRRRQEEERLHEEAEEKKQREKERQFLERLKIRMTLLKI